MQLALEAIQLARLERLHHQQRIDEEAVPRRSRHAAGRGVRTGDESHVLQVRHHVADRRRRQVEPGVLRQRARADRLALGDVALDQGLEQDLRALVEHENHCTLDRMPHAAVRPSFGRVALIGKLRSAEIAQSLRELREMLEQRGCEVLIERETASDLGLRGVDYAAIGAEAKLAIVVGGDGTMLAAARNLVRHHVPLVGVNQGRVGFMTDIGHDDMRSGIGAILEGRYSIEERALLEAEIKRNNKSVLQTVALNEAVVGKGSQGRLIEFNLLIDGEFVYTLRADGVIVATPTGSTAYAMSAQGPILHPAVPAFALVPLNPHTLSARPVSVSDRMMIEIVVLRALDIRGFVLIEESSVDFGDVFTVLTGETGAGKPILADAIELLVGGRG